MKFSRSSEEAAIVWSRLIWSFSTEKYILREALGFPSLSLSTYCLLYCLSSCRVFSICPSSSIMSKNSSSTVSVSFALCLASSCCASSSWSLTYFWRISETLLVKDKGYWLLLIVSTSEKYWASLVSNWDCSELVIRRRLSTKAMPIWISKVFITMSTSAVGWIGCKGSTQLKIVTCVVNSLIEGVPNPRLNPFRPSGNPSSKMFI